MRSVKHNGAKEPDTTLLELVLRVHGEFRRSLEPIRVTPLQAGMMLYLGRHAEAKLTDAADALCLRLPTLSDVVNDLVRKHWVTRRRSCRPPVASHAIPDVGYRVVSVSSHSPMLCY